MCGLAGIAGQLEHKDKEIFEKLMIVCSVRGRDSAGFVSVTAGNAVRTGKAVGSPYEMFEIPAWKSLNVSGDKLLMGHCRKATIGGISRATAHPFQEEHITGMHNGTLHWGWEKDLDDGNQFPVDSHAIIFNLAYNRPEDVFSRIKGAWAMTWWDNQDHTLNFLRNDERPLWYCMSANGKKMYWASEPWMLRVVLNHSGNELMVDEKGNMFFPLLVDTLRRFEVNPRDAKPFTMKADRHIEGASAQPAGGVAPFHQRQVRTWDFDNNRWREPEIPSPFKTAAKATPSGKEGAKEDRKAEPKADELNDSLPLLLSPPDTTDSVEESSSIDKSTAGSPVGTSTLAGSRRSRSMLSLVPSSKSTDSEESDSRKSNSSRTSKTKTQTSSKLSEPFLDYNGLPMSEDQFRRLTDASCCFCGDSVEYNEIPDKFQKWIDRDRFLCKGCNSFHGHHAIGV